MKFAFLELAFAKVCCRLAISLNVVEGCCCTFFCCRVTLVMKYFCGGLFMLKRVAVENCRFVEVGYCFRWLLFGFVATEVCCN